MSTYIISIGLMTTLLVGAVPAKVINIKPLTYEAPIQASTTQESLPPVLLKIAECESNNRQFTLAGDIVRGRANRADVGRFQINERWHLRESKRLGFDIYTWEGNTAYALYLYRKNGTKDWNWSKPCWGPKDL